MSTLTSPLPGAFGVSPGLYTCLVKDHAKTTTTTSLFEVTFFFCVDSCIGPGS